MKWEGLEDTKDREREREYTKDKDREYPKDKDRENPY